jgi:membrane protein
MYKRLKTTWELTKETFVDFFDDNPMDYAAIIAFYTIFSLPAVLIITIRIASAAFGEEAVRGEVANQISGIIGRESAEQIQNIIENASQSESSTIGTVIGIAVMIFSATTVFVALQNALNAMWQVQAKPEKGWLKMIVNRVLSLAMVVSMGFLLLVSLSVDVLLGLLNDYLQAQLSGIAIYLINAGNILVSVLISTVIFAIIYKVLPDAKIRWDNTWIGAFVTAVLFTIGKFVINIVLQLDPMADTYGAAGALVMVLMWVYYTSIVLLLGAEFTQVYSRYHDQGIQPADNAVKVETTKVEKDEDGKKKEYTEKKHKTSKQ